MLNGINQENVQAIMKIALLFEQGHKQDFIDLANKLESEDKFDTLPQDLKDVYEKIGDTPIAEPELYAITEKVVKNEGSIIEIALHIMNEDDLDKYDIDDISFLCGEVSRKVRFIKDKSGVFKTTPNISAWQKPKPSALIEYKKLQDELVGLKDDAKIEKMMQKRERFFFKACGLSKKDLSEWEVQLVVNQTEEALSGSVNSFLGKR